MRYFSFELLPGRTELTTELLNAQSEDGRCDVAPDIKPGIIHIYTKTPRINIFNGRLDVKLPVSCSCRAQVRFSSNY